MAKTDRPDELTSYTAFQLAVVKGIAEGARLDVEPEPAFIPYGRCHIHPSVSTFEHGFDVPCYRCEAEMEDYS
jgi:hypothetical protein